MNNLIDVLKCQNDKQEYLYLRSFLEDIANIPVGSMTDVNIAPMKECDKDLYIHFMDGEEHKRIIVVNRLSDIQDAKHLLDRYVYDAVVEDFVRELSFETWIGDAAMHCAYDDEYDNIRLVYITKDGTNPSENTLTKTLKNNILQSYVPLSYDKDVLPWLNTIISR